MSARPTVQEAWIAVNIDAAEQRERAEELQCSLDTAESQRDTLRTALIEAQSWIGNQLTANAVEANKRDALYFSIREALEGTA